jgi:hypothetical protein
MFAFTTSNACSCAASTVCFLHLDHVASLHIFVALAGASFPLFSQTCYSLHSVPLAQIFLDWCCLSLRHKKTTELALNLLQCTFTMGPVAFLFM